MEKSEMIYYYKKGFSKNEKKAYTGKEFWMKWLLKKLIKGKKINFHIRKQAFQVMSHMAHFPGI